MKLYYVSLTFQKKAPFRGPFEHEALDAYPLKSASADNVVVQIIFESS